MRDVACISVRTFKMVPRSCFHRVGVCKDEPAVKALNVSQIESAAALLPLLSLSLFIISESRGVLLDVSEVKSCSSTIKVYHTPHS